jgi:hypothetical protein
MLIRKVILTRRNRQGAPRPLTRRLTAVWALEDPSAVGPDLSREMNVSSSKICGGGRYNYLLIKRDSAEFHSPLIWANLDEDAGFDEDPDPDTQHWGLPRPKPSVLQCYPQEMISPLGGAYIELTLRRGPRPIWQT